MADFEIISKYLIHHYPDDFARFILGRDDVEVVELIESEVEKTMEYSEELGGELYYENDGSVADW